MRKKIAVTPDSQFAIGSATKAFTALSVMMSVEKACGKQSNKKAKLLFWLSDMFSTTLPADFAASLQPCFKVWGTLFDPQGGKCNQ